MGELDRTRKIIFTFFMIWLSSIGLILLFTLPKPFFMNLTVYAGIGFLISLIGTITGWNAFDVFNMRGASERLSIFVLSIGGALTVIYALLIPIFIIGKFFRDIGAF